MNCQEIQNHLPAFLEDLLSAEEKILIEKHLTSCVFCSRALEDLLKTESLLKNMEVVEPPPFFEQRIMARIREEAGRKKGLLSRLFLPLHIKVPLQAAATVLIAVLAFFVYQKNEPDMKALNPFPRPITQYEKDQKKLPSTKPPIVSPPIDAKARMVPESSPPASGQPRFAPAPPSEHFGKVTPTPDWPGPVREEIVSRPRPKPSPALTDREKLPPSPGTGFLGEDQGQIKKQEIGQIGERSFSELKENEKKDMAALPANESQKPKSAPVRLRSTGAALRMAVEIDLTVQVEEVNTGIRKIGEILDRTGARMTKRQLQAEGEFLRIEIPAGKTALFLDHLESVGRVTPDPKTFSIPEGASTINIKIIKRL
jgi:hypothetical protein